MCLFCSVLLNMSDFLVVHTGAGNQSGGDKFRYKRLIRDALRCSDLVSASIVLEESPLTNTGRGSSLTLSGEVECDASYIVRHHHGPKQAEMCSLYNIRHHRPILETMRISETLNRLYAGNEIGLIKPVLANYCLVVAATDCGVLADDAPLVTTKARHIYNTYKEESRGGTTTRQLDSSLLSILESHQPVVDTVGVIHISTSTTSVASSSGGNFFKLPGRIGCAAVLGSAIFSRQLGDVCISCMCSGNGEDIIMTMLSKSVTESIARRIRVSRSENGEDEKDEENEENEDEEEDESALDISEELVRVVQHEGLSIHQGDLFVGLICTIHDLSTDKVRLVYCHSTPSFYFGYRRKSQDPEIILSTLESSKAGIFCRGEFRL